jgi:enoyl-CoA hydratase
MDLKEADIPETPEQRRTRFQSSRDVEALAAIPQPTIAAINGHALGGGLEMALACDLRIIVDDAEVGLPELAHGLIPGGGATQRLPRLIGIARAAELIYFGVRLRGPEAVAWGIANRCVPRSELLPQAENWASVIAAQSPHAVRSVKKLIRESEEVPHRLGVETELEVLLRLMADRQESHK